MDNTEENIINGKPIPKHILDSKSNLSQYFIKLLNGFGNRTAMVDAVNGSFFTFANILNASYNIADWLKYEYGLQKSGKVGIFCENTIWYSPLMLAVWHVGGICVMFDYHYSSEELTHVLNLTKPELMITSAMSVNFINEATRQMDFIKYVCSIDLICNYRTVHETINFVPTNYENSQTCAIFFSSETTGLPKGVELSHKSIFLLTSIINNLNSSVDNSDVLMGVVPMFHGYGFLLNCLCMSFGTKLIVLKYFELHLFLRSIELYKISILHVVPSPMIYEYIIKYPYVECYDLSSLKVIYSGGASLPKYFQLQVIKRISANNSLKILQGYGMTESSFLSTYHDQDTVECAHSSVGKLMSGMAAKVIDLKNGKSLGFNKIGEICLKGPLLMKGYYKNNQETLATIDSDGWLHTGDVGYYDQDQYFYIVDRLNELIKYKDYLVSPSELEAVLLTHPEIDDAAVTGLPNKSDGELPIAFVVKSDLSKLTENDVKDFVNGQVSAQKCLRGGVKFVPYIPKNSIGKVLRKAFTKLILKSKL